MTNTFVEPGRDFSVFGHSYLRKETRHGYQEDLEDQEIDVARRFHVDRRSLRDQQEQRERDNQGRADQEPARHAVNESQERCRHQGGRGWCHGGFLIDAAAVGMTLNLIHALGSDFSPRASESYLEERRATLPWRILWHGPSKSDRRVRRLAAALRASPERSAAAQNPELYPHVIRVAMRGYDERSACHIRLQARVGNTDPTQ